MAFNPRTEYDIQRTNISIRYFADYADEYETRPPYQRKVVWDRKKQQALLDSLFRRFYIPSIVLRIVRLSEFETKYEVVDGQQRINTVQAFFNDSLPLPDTLADISESLPNSAYSILPAEIKKFIHRELKFDVDIIKNISDPYDLRHQKVATEIFWRLQQGESLNNMETAHARLSSLVRNFLVKYADDYDFDFEAYESIDDNPHKLAFFTETRARTNSRMQHLTLFCRFLLLEIANGPTSLSDRNIVALIDETIQEDGIGNRSYENEKPAKNVVRNLRIMREVFADDPLLDTTDYKTGILAFRHEYFTISCYMLLRHLLKHYAYDNDLRLCYRDFVWDFYRRTIGHSRTTDRVARFVENRQMGIGAVETREQIFRFEFFDFASKRGQKIIVKDEQRAFSEAQRIAIYLRDDGICQMCFDEGKPDRECIVPWTQFEADHVLPYSKGGKALIENGQVLCREHNQRKGATT